MTSQQQKLRALLARLQSQTTSQPATPAQLGRFVQRALAYHLEPALMNQLADFYALANQLRAEAILGFHSCDDPILFEWWDQQELWLSQRDFYALRWSRSQFCLGDASTRSFSPADQAASLAELLERCLSLLQQADADQ